MGTKKPPFWGTKTTLPPPDRPQESVDVTRIPAPGAKMPGSSQRLLPSNDPGGVSCPSTAAWYRWDFPIPRIRTFSRPDQKLLYQTGRKMQEQYRPRRKKCMFSSRVLRRKRINGNLWGKPWPRTTLSYRTSPLNWCGNLHRIPGCLSSYSLFYPFSGFYPREVNV